MHAPSRASPFSDPEGPPAIAMEGVPAFPDFTPMTLGVHAAIRSWTAGRVRHSDYDATSMLCFGDGRFLVSRIEDCLAIIFDDYTHEDRFLSVGGPGLDPGAFRAIRAFCAEENLGSFLHLVPEELANHLSRHFDVRCVWDSENFDYIYDLETLVGLKTRALRRRRRSATAFVNRYGQRADLKLVTDFEAVRRAVAALYGDGEAIPDIEMSAMRKLMAYWEHIRPLTYILYDGDHVVGIFIGEITPDQGIVHFCRTARRYTGSSSFLLREVCADLMRRGATSLNFEQDMGDAGLKEYKLSWQPSSFARKATISWDS